MSPYYENVNLDPTAQGLENKKVNLSLTRQPTPYLSGLKLEQDISLGSLVFNKIDSNNVIWVISDIEGWWGAPENQFPDLTRGWGDGSYDADGRYQSRIITLTGSILPPDPSLAAAARQTLIEATDLVYKGAILKVNEPGTAKTAFVRLSGRPIIRSVNPRGRMDFSIQLKAPDPIKYEYLADTYREISVTQGSTGVTVTNSGNTRTPVIFQLGGTITSGSLTNTYTSPFTNSSKTDTIGGITKDWTGTLQIDTYNRSMLRTVNGGDPELARSYASTLVDWIYIYPGTNTVKFQATGTSPTCTLYYRSGWIG
jgi:hypothetical protein